MSATTYAVTREQPPRYLPTPEEIRAACLAIHDEDRRRGIVRYEDCDRRPVELPAASARTLERLEN